MVDSTATPAGRPHDDPGQDESRLRGSWWRFVEKFGRFFKRFQAGLLITIFFILIAMIVLAPQIFITIPAGHVGVMWYRFFGGTVVDHTYGEGIHMIFPWDKMFVYDARLQNQARIYDTISSNGLSMEVDIAVRYRINREAAGMLHKLVGPNYPEILVYPEIGSHARELISRYTPEQLYTETRAFIQAEILERMVNELGSSLLNQSFQGRLVTVEDVLIRSVKLPERVANAIERKAEQYQIMQEYDFRLAREAKERDRKKIEAEGIREFQDIVAKTITEEYLRLRGIEATMSLATSKNSKTIIIGGKDGLPVILNTGETGTPSGSAAGTPELTGDSADSLPLPNETNANFREISPHNSVSPGVREEGGGESRTRPTTTDQSRSPAGSPLRAPGPEVQSSTPTARPANPDSEEETAPGNIERVMRSLSPIYDPSAGNASKNPPAPPGTRSQPEHEPEAQPEMKTDSKQ
ncbi:prohibitin family protein [Fodinicurvata sediminis]|uniref:prohibitin family protein n=1 Tax=Fodinicurvata sediminis TaxID=1121832 RepID=UPI0003B37EE6|nr:prohibitin family protein [Fodinicurvata sediminis]